MIDRHILLGSNGCSMRVTQRVSWNGKMLTDHRAQQEQWTRRRRERAQLARAFGYFIANLAAWDWFLTITLGDRHWPEERSARGELRQEANLVMCPPDPRLANYQPSPRWSAPSGAPAPGVALKRIERFLAHLQDMAAAVIGWVIAEEFGRLGGRWHCHGLITGVSRLYRKQCWQEARRRFGYTRIEPFDPARGAAFYAAMYAGRAEGKIHFGGTLAGVDLSHWERSPAQGGGRDIAVSGALGKDLFHMTLPRRHR